MFVRDAKSRCPHLVILSYDFEAYEEVVMLFSFFFLFFSPVLIKFFLYLDLGPIESDLACRLLITFITSCTSTATKCRYGLRTLF